LQQVVGISLKRKYLKTGSSQTVLETALGAGGRMIVFNDLQIDHLPKRQEVAPAERAWPRFRRSGLLNLEVTTSYIIDYSVLWALQTYDLVIVS
jgi:hypothetical protein